MLRFPILALFVAVLFACSAPPPSSSPPPPVPATARPEIVIDRVEAGNPVRIEGTARTFENNVILRVRDAQDRLMVETFTTARGDMGQHNPFAADVFLTSDPGGRITVEALEYSAKDGSERSLTRTTTRYDVPLVRHTLYLPDRDCTRVDPLVRSMPKSISTARLLLEALLRDAASPFPRGSEIRSVNLRDGVLTVDFNERLQNVGGSCAALMIRESVERTMKALPTVNRVVITAGGSQERALQP